MVTLVQHVNYTCNQFYFAMQVNTDSTWAALEWLAYHHHRHFDAQSSRRFFLRFWALAYSGACGAMISDGRMHMIARVWSQMVSHWRVVVSFAAFWQSHICYHHIMLKQWLKQWLKATKVQKILGRWHVLTIVTALVNTPGGGKSRIRECMILDWKSLNEKDYGRIMGKFNDASWDMHIKCRATFSCSLAC